MKTTAKHSCLIIIDLLVAHGVEDIVLSPGSRNAPLIVAAVRDGRLRCHTVIDERCAAFFALGIALQTSRPVAMVCTSGSAVLNYGPALAEALYRQIPLIAISADRPEQWIDQDDSQTIRQAGVLSNIVKHSCDISVETGDTMQLRYINRTVNDAIIEALKLPLGPVHINVRLDEPLGRLDEPSALPLRVISTAQTEAPVLTDEYAARLADKLKGKRVMVIAGFGRPDSHLDQRLERFAKMTGAVVLTEAQSNIHISDAVKGIDTTLSVMSEQDRSDMHPDIVITFGGSIVSRMIKAYLRGLSDIEHWHIGFNPYSIDCFMSLTERIMCRPADFFESVTSHIENIETNQFHKRWMEKTEAAIEKVEGVTKHCGWSDFYAMHRLLEMIPADWNIHVGNGTSIRYMQMFDHSRFARIECNRGVSGIDGSTSTAIGAQAASSGTTLLICGDMSAQYDAGALAINEISPRFKMIVLNNDGGGIFRFIRSTSALDECERFFASDVKLPLRQLADGYGFAYYETRSEQDLERVFDDFASQSEKPAVLNIITPAAYSTKILKQFFNIPTND